jgi:hypothetical protein
MSASTGEPQLLLLLLLLLLLQIVLQEAVAAAAEEAKAAWSSQTLWQTYEPAFLQLSVALPAKMTEQCTAAEPAGVPAGSA